MCYFPCGMVHIKHPMLLIEKMAYTKAATCLVVLSGLYHIIITKNMLSVLVNKHFLPSSYNGARCKSVRSWCDGLSY